MRVKGSSLVCVMLLAGLGCGDDGDSGGVASAKKVGELTESETTSLCDDVDEYFARFEAAFVSVTCTDVARVDEDTCVAERKSCIADTPTEGALGGDVEFECTGGSGAITSECEEITVRELKACINAIIGLVEDLADQYTCTADVESIAPPTTPKACLDLGSRCPQLAEFSLGDD